jgi:F420-dependent oxidoreductase-like protein
VTSKALDVRFGLHLDQRGKSWTHIIREFQIADDLGFDTAWVSDHLLSMEGTDDGPILEAWTLLAAIAALTSRIRIGVLVTSNTFRHPALLAKQAVTVDHISEGRLILGLGAGWREDEHRRYGLAFPQASVRVDRLEETVRILHALMGQKLTTFSGDHYDLVDAPLEPKAIQQPRIPILIAAHQPRMIRVAARFADQWDTYATQAGTSTSMTKEDLASRVNRFEAACRDAGRDPSTIRRSTTPAEDVFSSESAYVDFVRRSWMLGFTDFIAEPPPGLGEQVRNIAERTIPALRAELRAQTEQAHVSTNE